MRLSSAEARSRFVSARVARLATASAEGVPHLVPVTFAVRGDVVVFAVDHKPKSSVRLRRLRNIAANPAVCFLADGYSEDWSQLWWVRADGLARVEPPGAEPVSWLVAKYEQYRQQPPEHAVVVTQVHTWSGWSGS